MQSKNSSSRIPSARGQSRKPPTPSPYLTTTELMAKIRNAASSTVNDQLTKVKEVRNQTVTKSSLRGTTSSTGTGRPQSKSSRVGDSVSDITRNPTMIDFSKDRSRLFTQKGAYEKPGPTKSTGNDSPLANAQLPPPGPPRQANSSRASSRKSVAKSKEVSNAGTDLPVINDKEPLYHPHYKNLGMGDTPLVGESDTDSKENLLKGPVKSILKIPTHCANGGYGTTKLKNRVVLSDEDMYAYESPTWTNGYTARRVISANPNSDRKVKFHDEVKVHPVPYESRGSTEWQHNLLLSREMMLQRFLADPRMGLFPDLFGSKSHPVASMHEAFDLPPKSKPQIRHRPTPRFPRKL